MKAVAGELQGASDGAKAQLLIRQLNEQIRSIADGRDLDVVCECVNGACLERLELTLDDYEAVRRFPTRFVVKQGHVAEDAERAVESHDGVVVVEKSGADAERAILLDPRRPPERRLHAVADADQAPARAWHS